MIKTIERQARKGRVFLRFVMRTGIFLLWVASPGMSDPAFAEDAARAEKPVIVGIVTDGSTQERQDVRDLFINELLALTANEFKIETPESKRLDGGWSVDKIRQAVESLENDPEVDIVITLSPAASVAAVTQKECFKPTFAPLLINDRLLGFKRTDNKTGIKNLNYLTGGSRFDDDLKTFRSVAPVERVAMLMDDALYEIIPEDAKQKAVAAAKEQGVGLSFVSGGPDVDALLAKIPDDIQGVIMGPMPRLDKASKRTLIDGVNARKIASMCWAGEADVEEGVLMSTQPASDFQRIARRMALNIQAVLRGEEAGDQPVLFERKQQLRINAGTARAIGASPSFAVLGEAILVNEDSENTGAPLTLEGAAMESIEKNLSIIAGRLGVKANSENVAIARSVLLPQVESSLNLDWQKDSYPTVQNGSVAERSTNGSVGVRQTIFSESALAQLAVQQHLNVANEAQQRTLELDIVESTTTAFLNVLVAQTQLNIQKDNLALARENLDLAKDRVQAGTVDVSDVYRWESEIATARQNVLAAKANLEQQRDNLNFYLHRPITERFLVEPATLDDPNSMIRRKELPRVIDNPRSFNLMGEFMVREGVELSPELAQLKAQLKAQQRQLTSDQLSFFSPDVMVTGDVGEVFNEDRVAGSYPSLEDKVNWGVGIEVSLPLFEGGKRGALVSQSKLLVEQLRVREEEARQQVEEAVRQQLHAIRASYPSIELSSQGAEAARKNYDLVRDKYVRGRCSIVELLDAQKASLNADQAAANAVFTYFIDLMRLQRSVGEYYFFFSDPRRDEAIDRMMAYIAKGGKS